MPRHTRHPPIVLSMTRALVRAMDALSRGASPPGMIDILHTRDSQLRRRFTMIARYDGKLGCWSGTGVLVSVVVAGVALTGAVRGQNAAPAQPPQAAQSAQPAAGRQVTTEVRTPAAAEPAGEERPAAPAVRRPSYQPVEDEDVDRAVLAQLDRPIPELNFDGAGLSDVIDFLRDVSGTNLIVEWGPFSAAGLDRNIPVSLRLKNVRFGQALELVLSSAGGGSVPLGYTIDRNVIRISTTEHLDRITDIRAYDVRDIVPAEMPMPELTKMITEAVAPDSWRESGGSVGTVHASKHKLIVKQTPMNHRQVRDVLKMLREDPSRVPQATDAASAAQAAPAQRPN